MVKILAILYSGGKTVEKGNRLLGTVEKQIWHQKLAQKRRARTCFARFMVTDDKEGPASDFKNILPMYTHVTAIFLTLRSKADCESFQTKTLIIISFHPG